MFPNVLKESVKLSGSGILRSRFLIFNFTYCYYFIQLSESHFWQFLFSYKNHPGDSTFILNNINL